MLPNLPKLLLDENLSPEVARRLCEETGVDAIHVRDRGLTGASDSKVFDYAYRDDGLVVASSIRDFLRLAAAAELHAGVMLIERSSLSRDEQFEEVMRGLDPFLSDPPPDHINTAIHVRADRVDFEELPRSA